MNGKRDDSALCAFDDARAGVVAACGGKAVGLHRLVRAGLPVPPGFCVTTAAFEQVVAGDRAFRAAVLSLDADADGPSLRDRARAVRVAVLACPLPQPFAREVVDAWAEIAGRAPVAVRSSATAEDLADASFAGQQDTYLSIANEEALLDALRGCWASLFTERAVSYRRQRGIASARVSMAVVIQRMVRADAAGVLFTADPLTGQRGVSVIEAVAGLGEALGARAHRAVAGRRRRPPRRARRMDRRSADAGWWTHRSPTRRRARSAGRSDARDPHLPHVDVAPLAGPTTDGVGAARRESDCHSLGGDVPAPLARGRVRSGVAAVRRLS